ncbi:uncharacterized protein LOC111022774 [Momordica charantia]|uniref:Uncharacterized protein LOC111022774 n=1 Tax=Momordica charantia TaxID=3673 RepID=A0A6J1DNS3_MOMCH|nr:uncharacterized protein LOC111022774 [Momordica charantia]
MAPTRLQLLRLQLPSPSIMRPLSSSDPHPLPSPTPSSLSHHQQPLLQLLLPNSHRPPLPLLRMRFPDRPPMRHRRPKSQRLTTDANWPVSTFQPSPSVDLHHKHTAKVVCLVCQLLITSGSIYFCSRSDSYFHQQCAELPREILNLVFHHHPLFLFPRPFVYNSLCDSCRNECVGFFYGCPLCNFNLHVACLSSFKHQHTFLNLRRVLSYDCQACGKSERGFPWFCNICHLSAHKKCADLPLVLQTSEHCHLLDLTFSLHQLGLNNCMCKTCGEEINKSYAAYVCRQCSYVAHLGCADSRRIEIFNERSVDANNDINLEGGILHFSHEHNLSLCSGGDRHCDGCMRYIQLSPNLMVARSATIFCIKNVQDCQHIRLACSIHIC